MIYLMQSLSNLVALSLLTHFRGVTVRVKGRAQRGYDEVPDEPVRLLKGLGVIAQFQ